MLVSFKSSLSRSLAPLGFVIFSSVTLMAHSAWANEYLADYVVSSKSKSVSLSEVTDQLSKAKLLAIGETHSAGVEREHIKNLYSDLASKLPMQPECFAETFPVLISPTDIVYPLFTSICKSVVNVLGNGPAQTTFAKPFSKAFDNGIVLTQSGHRHVMTMGQYFPNDYTPANVDIAKNNTISTQIPKKHIGKQMVSVTFQGVDELPVFMLSNELKQLIAIKSKTKFKNEGEKRQFVIDELLKIETKIRLSGQKLMSEFTAGDQVNYYQLENTQSVANPNRISFFALYTDNFAYDPNVMSQLLLSDDLANFVLSADVKSGLYARIVKSGELSYSNIVIQKSGIFVFSGALAVVSHPTGHIESKHQ